MKKIKISFELVKIIISGILGLSSLFFKDKQIVYLVLIGLSYILISYELYLRAIKNLFKGEIFDENFLMIIATIGSIVIGKYAEGIMVIWLFQVGEYFADLAVDNSKKSITKLMDLRSDKINLLRDDDIVTVETKQAKLGDVFIVKPGELIPLDGIVIEGNSFVDVSSLLGESVPRSIHTGENVLSGCINTDSIIKVKATSIYETSTSSRIIELIENSNEKKTKTEKFITKFAKIYTPIVVLFAVLLVLIPVCMGYNFSDWLYRALIFLVISCPCALVISVPLGFFCGIGKASKNGILVKGSTELENLSKISTVVFDKTGTITKGVFNVNKICAKDMSEDDLLRISAHGQYYSNHPISKSILSKYSGEIDENAIKDFKEITGKGVMATVLDKPLIIGNARLLEENNVMVEDVNEIGTITYVSYDGKYAGYLLINDEIKEEAFDIVKELKLVQVKNVAMLSGDNQDRVKDVCDKVGISNYYAGLLPKNKVEKINELKKNSFTAFVGDGINDAPVIKLADIGIAMGGVGSDITIEASDIVLMKDDLAKIPEAIKISRYTLSIIKFNIVFAILVKVIFLVFGALGFSSVWFAVFADVGVTLFAIINALRIMRKKF